ncbi:MAG: S8 family serine peptidase [Chloroflexi bacterium]|nr:S8 family serine peptidase [Chloroflexota bacterium]
MNARASRAGAGGRRVLAALTAVIALGFAASPATGAPAPPPAPDRVVVQYDTGVRAQALASDAPPPSLKDLGYRSVEVPAGKSREQFLAELRNTPGVISAVEDAKAYAAAVPNDPYYALNQQYLATVGAPQAWDLVTGANSSIVVAVLDSGIDLGQEDFAGRLWENPRDADTNGVDDDGNGCVDDRYGCRIVDLTPENAIGCGYTSSAKTGAVADDNGTPGSANHSHGTLVAGIIGAAGNNNKGVTGVAWDVKLMTVKVLDCGRSNASGFPEGSFFNVAQGIDYARQMGANIISLSVASRPGDQTADSPFLRAAIDAAQKAGIIIVAAAGNHGPTDPVGPGYPAAYTEFPNVIAVGSSDANGNWATFSDYGPAIDFAAPGVNIASTARSDLGLTSPYRAGDGTSFSTPLVTGMFALMMARNSRLQAADYIQIARDAATPAPAAPHGQNWAGAGIINIGAAVARVPMSVTGSALRDWRDVPPGTVVSATIGGIECGAATTIPFGLIQRFSLLVKAEAERPGCGAPGKTVQFAVGGFAATQTFPWAQRDQDLGLVNKDLVSVSPPPGQIVVQTLNGAWSNLAHLDPTGPMPGALAGLSSPWTELLRWDPAKPFLETSGAWRRFIKSVPGYVNDVTTLEQYDAYWVNGAAANVATLNPNPASGRRIGLAKGWNNFVFTGGSRSVADALSEIEGKYTQVLQYDNATGQWLTYLPGQQRYLNDFGGLFKLQVYWVYMTQVGSIAMP